MGLHGIVLAQPVADLLAFPIALVITVGQMKKSLMGTK